MKLLVITNNPQRASFRQRFGVYLPILAAEGIDCRVVALPAGTLARLQLYRRARNYDGVIWHKKAVNPIDAFFLRRYAPRLLYNYDDALMFSDKRPESDSPTHRRRFLRTLKLAEIVLVGSHYLSEQARPHHSKVFILPLGLEVSRYGAPIERPTDGRIRLVWIGSKSTLGYLKALSPVLDQLAKRHPNLTLRIIGDEFFDLDRMPVEKVIWDANKRYADLTQCDIGLAPLPNDRFSMGKCSFKVLEYSASGLPVVGSPVGTNSDHILDGKTGFLAETHDQWRIHLDRLIADPDLRRTMGSAGRFRAANYDISVVGRKLVEILTDWLSNSEWKESRSIQFYESGERTTKSDE
ncbi:MAG: glycosyltransferase family 4 protein [Phycisphaerae bacterium]|nr:glycosyltransferase family 4 protein [Phycisphaerae bacterium]